MIHINKPIDPPDVLHTKGKKATKVFCREYAKDPFGYRKGTRSFDFSSEIYAHDSVKDALQKAQHDKCAFCESKITATGYGDIEHFRPKKGYQQKKFDKLKRPGYYWLAYEWKNLFLSCQICNQRFKRNLFPLRKPSMRAKSHEDDYEQEEPLLIDPSGNPEKYLIFRGEEVLPRKRCREGTVTIEVFGLDRAELVEDRRDHRTRLRTLKTCLELLRRTMKTNSSEEIRVQIIELQILLEASKHDRAEYAAMARCLLLG